MNKNMKNYDDFGEHHFSVYDGIRKPTSRDNKTIKSLKKFNDDFDDRYKNIRKIKAAKKTGKSKWINDSLAY